MLLDTDVVSFILKDDSCGEVYFERVKGQQLYVSLITAAELYQWAKTSHWQEPTLLTRSRMIGSACWTPFAWNHRRGLCTYRPRKLLERPGCSASKTLIA